MCMHLHPRLQSTCGSFIAFQTLCGWFLIPKVKVWEDSQVRFSFEDQISMNLGLVQPWGIRVNHAEYLASALSSALQSSYLFKANFTCTSQFLRLICTRFLQKTKLDFLISLTIIERKNFSDISKMDCHHFFNHCILTVNCGSVVVSSPENCVSFLTCLSAEELMTFMRDLKDWDTVITIQLRNCAVQETKKESRSSKHSWQKADISFLLS